MEGDKPRRRRRIRWDNVLKLVLGILLIYIVFFQYQTIIELFAGVDEESSEMVARNFVTGAPTYDYDGRDLELINTKPLDCRNCWEFTYQFKTQHPGYGDRSEEPVEEIVEGHKIKVKINNRQIESAIIDEYWDEIQQKRLE